MKNILAKAGAVMIGATILASPASAFKISDLDPTKILRAVTQANVNVHNNYPYTIRVVMDSNREAHIIASGGVAKFTRANKGDRPTFRAYRDGAVVNSKSVFLDGNKTVDFR